MSIHSERLQNVGRGATLETYHGCVTDQLRKTPARPRSMKSVTTALPFLKRRPDIAGRKAKARDSDGKDDDSSAEDPALLGSRG